MAGLGCAGWSDGWNCLDGVIVLESIVEILITDVLYVVADGSLPKLSFLRILRMFYLRVLRLMRSGRASTRSSCRSASRRRRWSTSSCR